MKYKHFLITRFNIPLWRTKDKDPIHDIHYLKYRMQLFEDYCFPSVRQQTNQNFVWLCLFDVNTPREIKERLEVLHQDYNNFCPLYLDVNENVTIPQAIIDKRRKYDEINARISMAEVSRDDREYVERIQRLITPAFLQQHFKQYMDVDTEWILTTRLDNDDVLYKGFIEEVQLQYKKNPGNYVLNFLYGYQFLVQDKLPFVNKFLNNHFTTLAERNDENVVSILFYNHTVLEHHLAINNVSNKQPMFIEMLHGGNVCNSLTLDKDLTPCYSRLDMSGFAPKIKVGSTFHNIWKFVTKYKGVMYYILKNR